MRLLYSCHSCKHSMDTVVRCVFLSAPLCPLCPSLPLSAPLCPSLPSRFPVHCSRGSHSHKREQGGKSETRKSVVEKSITLTNKNRDKSGVRVVVQKSSDALQSHKQQK